MDAELNFSLQLSPLQAESLRNLQSLFAAACNHLAPTVRANRCWNRVALHHLAYREVRERFPQLGSQMACNAIYSVCRFARNVYQHPHSPWNPARRAGAPLPLLRFMPDAPVFFDRHTLSLKDNRLSMFTLDGRLHFRFDLSDEVRRRFSTEKLREIALLHRAGAFSLQFCFAAATGSVVTPVANWADLPEYLIVEPVARDGQEDSAPKALAA